MKFLWHSHSVRRSLLITCSFVVLTLQQTKATEFHVATTGNDKNSGAKDAPFASLTAARDAIRVLRADKEKPLNEAVTVWIHGGTYEISQMLTLEAQDSGTEEFPVTFRAAEDTGTPLFIGAPKVTNFTPHQEEILKADVSALGLKDITIRQLLFNGERQPLARYPNRDNTDLLYKGWAFLKENPTELPKDHDWKNNAYINKEDIRKWAHPEDVEINIFAYYAWWNWIMPVQSVDLESGKLTLAKPCGYDLHPYNRYFFQNALEELDAPGEWYLDKRAQTLYFWPPSPMANAEVRIPKLESFIRLTKDTKHITIRGLHFTGCNGTAILVENSEHCTIAACTLTHVGAFHGSGININGGKNNTAVGNDISYTGNAGIGISGGDKIKLTSANNVADNNHIHHVGAIQKNGPGISLNGVGNKATHNLIHHCPRMAIQFGGNNLVIEYNHMHHTVLETQDGGAVYTGGRDWISSRGTKLRYNFIHDTIGVGQGKDGLHWPHFTWGIYMDDNAGGLDITHNIVARSARAGLHLHNGRDHLIENNIFVDGGERQVEFNGWKKEHHFYTSHFPTMIKGWDSIKDEPAWKGMRNIELDPRDAIRDDGSMMSGNIFKRNIIAWNDAGLRYLDVRNCTPKYNTADNNLVWNNGHPIGTGISKVGSDKGTELLNMAALLENTDAGKTPKGWGWNHRPDPKFQITTTDGIVSVPAGTSDDPKNKKSVIHAPHLPFKAGTAYRTRFKVRSTEPSTSLTFSYGVYASPGGYWATPEKQFTATQEWQEVEVTGTLPKETDSTYKAWMKTFWLRMDVNAEKGSIELKEIITHEAEPMNNWVAWQSEGWDKNSVVANPHFVSAASDDYRLNPDSPALKLGFEQIPIEKIGLYPSELRAK